MKNTLTAECIAKMQIAEVDIYTRLGFTLDEQAKMIYDNGVMFLNEYFKNIPEMGRMMERDRQFWQWWKLEWYMRNMVFMEDAELPNRSIALQRIAYEALHNGKSLTECIKPARIVYVGILPTLKHTA